jgi:hypothetical protein
MYLTEIIVPLGIFATIAFIVKTVSDNQTRKYLADKGVETEALLQIFASRRIESASSSLKWGLVLIAIGASIFLAQFAPAHIRDEVLAGAVFLSAGVGLLVFYVLKRKKQNEI